MFAIFLHFVFIAEGKCLHLNKIEQNAVYQVCAALPLEVRLHAFLVNIRACCASVVKLNCHRLAKQIDVHSANINYWEIRLSLLGARIEEIVKIADVAFRRELAFECLFVMLFTAVDYHCVY
jgi:hypothetical protein